MKNIQKSVLIWHSAEQMYQLVIDVERYPEFLPWCDLGRVIWQNETGMEAEVGLNIKGLRHSFVTRNEHVPGRRVHIKLVKGPFSALDGVWTFMPIEQSASVPGAETPTACRVELNMHYGFSNRALQMVVGPVFDRVAGTLVDAFIKRADQVYR